MTTEKNEALKRVENELEDNLGDLAGIAATLKMLAENDGEETRREALDFLANEIEDHRNAAYNAYVQLFGYDDFSEKSGGPGPLVVARCKKGGAS